MAVPAARTAVPAVCCLAVALQHRLKVELDLPLGLWSPPASHLRMLPARRLSTADCGANPSHLHAIIADVDACLFQDRS